MGEEEYNYYTWDRDATIDGNSQENLTVKGDGSTVIRIYYKRNRYTLTFSLGTRSGNSYGIYTNSGNTNTTSVSSNVTLSINGESYTIGGENYTITAKYGETIADKWAPAATHINPTSIRSGYTTYYVYGWNYRKNGSSSYTTQVSSIYTLNKDLLLPRSDGGYEGNTFYLYWITSQLNYTVHYMFETLDGSGQSYNGQYSYYQNHDFKENEAYQTKIASTSMGYKTIDGFNYYASASSEKSGNDIYLYYLRDTYTITFYNVNGTIVPNIDSQYLKNGISLGNDCINVKYEADIGDLENILLENADYPVSTLGTGEWTFDKWYTDAYYTIPMTWRNSNGEGTKLRNSLMLYAKWTAPEYMVTFDVNQGTWTDDTDYYVENENGKYTIKVDEGGVLKAPKEPYRYGYDFDGWYYIDNSTGEEKELIYLFSESQYIYGDLELEAKWNPRNNISYTVKYVEAQYDGDTLITDISQYQNPTYIAEDKVVPGKKFGAVVAENALIIKTYENGRFYVPDAAMKALVLNNENQDDNILYFFYTSMENLHYRIYHVLDTGIRYEKGQMPDKDLWIADPEEHAITTPEEIYVSAAAKTINGYQAENINESLLLVSDETQNTIYFYYNENAVKGKYKVNYFFMKENNNYGITPDYSATGEKATGMTIYAKDYLDYLSADSELYKGHEFDEELSDSFGIITSSGEETVLNLYFKNILYNVNYHLQGGTWTDTNSVFTKIDDQTYNLQTTYYNTAESPMVPVKDGHRFLGWYGITEEDGFTGNLYDFSKTVSSNTDLYAVWAEETEIEINKIWNDDNNRDGIRPENVRIAINNYGDVVLNRENEVDANTWKSLIQADMYDYTDSKIVIVYINDLGEEIVYNSLVDDDSLKMSGMKAISKKIVVADGEKLEDVLNNMDKIEYVAQEQDVPEGYTVIYSEDTYTITNIHQPEMTTKTVTKIWDDNNNQDGKRPDSVKLQLKINGSLNTEITLKESSNWSYEWGDLFVYENGEKIEYAVEEVDVPQGYEASYDQDTLTVTNKHIPEKIEKTVVKIWDDNNNQDGKRPDSIEVQLLADGKETRKNGILNQGNNWSYTYENLDKYKDGNEIVYTIKEITEVPEYETAYSDDTFTITNKHIPELITKTVTKIWDDNNNQDGKRPENIELQLFANGEKVGEKVVATKEKNWGYTFENLPRYKDGEEIKYTVEETAIPDYTTNYSDDTFTITNVHIPEKADKTVTKIWRDGDNIDGFRPDSVELQLYANGEAVGNPVTLTQDDATQGTNYWEYTYKDLDVYKDGEKINYTVKEPEVPEQYGVIYNQEKLYVYNAFPPEVNIVVEKVWDDNNDGDRIRPKEIQVQLLADGENYEIDGQNLGLVTLNEENNWTHKFEFLQKYNSNNNVEKYVYTIKEITEVPQYTTTYDEKIDENEYRFEIINSYEPQTTDRKIVNVWNDNDNQDGIRPDELKVHLLANGEFLEEVTLNEDGSWSKELPDLWLNEAGTEIEYTIEVVTPNGYTSKVEYDEVTKTFNIETSHIPEKIDIFVNKEWNDNDNQDGIRPDEVEVTLLANGEVQDVVILNEANSWRKNFEGLDKCKEGKEIDYTVKETEITGYTPQYDKVDNTITVVNTHIPEVKNLRVTKIWDDDDDRDGIRPTGVEVHLLANDIVIDTVVLTESENWSHIWEGLDVYNSGEKITYTIDEISKITDYTTTYEIDAQGNFTITNKHIPYTTERTVAKVWDDNNNQDGKRPESIRVQLYADSEKTGSEVILNEENGWTYTWPELDERISYTNVLADGTIERKVHVINYTVKEVEIPNEYSVDYSKDTFTITNTHIPSKIEKQITKLWDDQENSNNTRPESISVALLANGQEYETVELNSGNNWTYKWSDLDEYKDGKEIKYTACEIAEVPHYTTKYSDDELTITNELNKYGYRIEYYYDGVLDPEETVTSSDYFGNIVNSYEDKVRDGYKFEKEENAELRITEDEQQNVMKIYYVKDVFEYTIEYYYDGVLDADKTVRGSEEFGTVIDEYEDKIIDGYELKEVVGKPLVITSKSSSNVMKVYYEKAQYEYTIEYYYDGIEAENERIVDRAVYSSYIDTYPNKCLNGYKLEKEENLPLQITSNSANNIIRIFYIKDEFAYTIEYYHDDVIVPEKTVTGKALFGSVIDTYEEKLDYGYRKVNVENLPLTISYDTSKNVIKVYYVKKDTQVIVNHIDINNNQILDTVTKTGKVGDEYETTSKNIEGYVLVKPTENVKVTMTEEVQTVNYYYVHVSGGVIEKHVDKITGDILYNTTHVGNEGTEYTTDAKKFEGYKLVGEIPENASGTMTIDVIEVTYYYVKEITVDVLYIDDVTGKTLKSVEISGLEGEKFTTEQKDISGYEIIKEKLPTNGEGNLSRDNTEVKYFYIRKTRLIIKRIDEKTGLEIVQDEIRNGVQNEYYETEGIELDNYVLDEKKMPENGQGQLLVKENSDGTVNVDTVVIYYYIHRAGGVIVQYIDETTGEVIEDQTLTGLEGDEYSVVEKEIPGYELMKTADNSTGNMTVDIIYVKYYYKKKSKVSIQYIDENSDMPILAEDVLVGLEGDEYTAFVKDVEGYMHTRTKGEVSGNMGAETTIIRHYYKRTTKVIVRYLEDKTEKELLETVEIPGLENDQYTTEAKNIPYYKLKVIPQNKDGKMEMLEVGDITVVTYYYEKQVFDLKIESTIKDIQINGESKGNSGDFAKFEIDKDFANTDVKVVYAIKVSNVGEIPGRAETIIDYIPQGFEFVEADNDESWKLDSNMVTTEILKDTVIHPGQEKTIDIVLTWTRDGSNLGTIENIARIGTYANVPNFEDVNLDNNITQTTILMAVRTGAAENNIVMIIILVAIIEMGVLAEKRIRTLGKTKERRIGKRIIREYLKNEKNSFIKQEDISNVRRKRIQEAIVSILAYIKK